MRIQHTLGGTAHFDGFGYWSGQDVHVSLHPAPPNAGIFFRRIDIPGSSAIPGNIRCRGESPRRTTLIAPDGSGAEVGMVEHLMAALTGMGVDNVEIHCDAPELPGLDGSSGPIVQAIQSVGLVSQSEPSRERRLLCPIRMEANGAWIQVIPATDGRTRFQYEIDYGDRPVIPSGVFRFSPDEDDFAKEVASSRTFILKHEAEQLRQHGFGLRVRPEEVLILDDNGPLQNKLRFVDECARHKLLDMMGDMTLMGFGILGHFSAYRSGHQLNARLVQEMWQRKSEIFEIHSDSDKEPNQGELGQGRFSDKKSRMEIPNPM